MKTAFLSVLLAAILVACPDPPDVTAPAIPTGLKAEAGDGSVKLSWQANTEKDLKGYLINWRESLSSQPGKSQTSLATSTIAGLVNGKTYIFTVSSLDQTGNKSVASEQVISSPKAPNVPVVNQPPATPRGLIATPQDAQVALNWTPNSELDLKSYTVNYGTSATALDQSLNLDSTQTSTVITKLNNDTTYFFALEAQSSSRLKSIRSEAVQATPKAVPLSPFVSSVTITDYGSSNQVRQGAGAIEITVKGSHLETLDGAKLGSDALTIKSKQADGAVLAASITHGATLGDLTLTVTNPVGPFSAKAAVEVVKVTVAANAALNPSDTTGKGTPNRPYRTVSKGLSVAQKGDTVLLTAGIYTTDETWPQAATLAPPPNANVSDGVTVEGASATDPAAVVLIGPGAEQNASGLVLAGSATIRNLSLRAFRYAILHVGSETNPTAQIDLRQVVATSSWDGFHLRYAQSLNVLKSELKNNSATGIYAVGATTVTVTDSSSTGNLIGMYGENGVNLQMTGTTCNSNSSDGIRLVRSSLSAERIESNKNGANGINMFSQNGEKQLSLRQSSLSENSKHGIWIQGQPDNINLGRYDDDFTSLLLNDNAGEQVYDDRISNTYSYFFIKAQIKGAATPTGAFGKGATPAGVTITQPGNSILFNNPI
jgi:Right handed beta helix region/Fibronectin type III domain